MSRYKYYALNKPYGVLSQFTKDHPGQSTLAELLAVEKDVYPVGRLDKDSEGLLLLTNDKSVNQKLLHPKNRHKKTYWAQVEGQITEDVLEQLRKGVIIKHKGKAYHTLPCMAEEIEAPAGLWDRNPPIRYRKNIPTSWVEITLHEGKNRQVRKMMATVGFPVLRLIRAAIEGLQTPDSPGRSTELSQEIFYAKLELN
ncbi:MAG TPA: pseudouridine synthase [Saprospiraceae bacterium]|nr:pseudouridine synthase [Saprospiraceae bacterium]